MTLKEVCEIGYSCGLTTIQEAILNAELHWDVFTTFSDFDKDFNKLYEECDQLIPEWGKKDILIQGVFPDIEDVFPDFEHDPLEGEYPY